MSRQVPPTITSNGHELEYATTWFTYHANQRYQAVFIYVIQLLMAPIAAVTAAFFSSKGDLSAQQIQTFSNAILMFGIVGLVMSIVFLLLDMRNLELVKVGEMALLYHERVMPEDARILKIKEDTYPRGKRHWLFSHSILLRAFFILGSIIYVGIIYISFQLG